MPLVIKNNTLPHLKGLNSIWDPKLALGVAVILWVSCLLKKCSFHIIGTQTSGLFCSQLYLPFLARCYCEKWWDSLWCQFETRRIYGRLFRTSEREKYGGRIITSAETLRGWSGGHISSSLTALVCVPAALVLAATYILYLLHKTTIHTYLTYLCICS